MLPLVIEAIQDSGNPSKRAAAVVSLGQVRLRVLRPTLRHKQPPHLGGPGRGARQVTRMHTALVRIAKGVR